LDLAAAFEPESLVDGRDAVRQREHHRHVRSGEQERTWGLHRHVLPDREQLIWKPTRYSDLKLGGCTTGMSFVVMMVGPATIEPALEPGVRS
jgi:hypothetical protein